MKKIAVIHYLPIEYYPPVMNTLNFLGGDSNLKINVFTTLSKGRSYFDNKKIRIKRFPFHGRSANKLVSILEQLLFNLGTILNLIALRPDTILYYESYSALPVFFYSKFINKEAKVFIHFHEYFPPEWYRNGMKLVKLYHKLEKKYLFVKAKWISQTNSDRIKLFRKDFPFININNIKALPNYPPKQWISTSRQGHFNEPIKVVYVGSLSIRSTYIKEFCEWVISMDGGVIFDIYCFNTDSFTKEYLLQLNTKYITLYSSGIDYFELPVTLSKYDVGVILYTADELNFKYNAPNKLFEYLVCDLDVWFPNTMDGMLHYKRGDSYPKVLELDFCHLNEFDISSAIDRTNLKYRGSDYNAENVNAQLLQELLN